MGWKTGVTTHSLFCLNLEKEEDTQLSCKSNHNAYESGEAKHQLFGLISPGLGLRRAGSWSFSLCRVTGAFLLPGIEFSPAFLHKVRKSISSFCSFRDRGSVEREQNLEANDLNSSLSSLYLKKERERNNTFKYQG